MYQLEQVAVFFMPPNGSGTSWLHVCAPGRMERGQPTACQICPFVSDTQEADFHLYLFFKSCNNYNHHVIHDDLYHGPLY